MNSNKIIIGVLAGMAAGALLGVLYAPAKGSDTRKKISKTGRDLSDAVKDKYHGIRETFSGQFMSGRSKVSDNSNPGAVKADAA
jgi:gas vesicle protein